MWAALAIAAAAAVVQTAAAAGELNYIVANEHSCLSLGDSSSSSRALLLLLPCSASSPSQQFDLSANRLELSAGQQCVDNGPGLAATACSSATTNWWFYADGRIMSQQLGAANGCLGTTSSSSGYLQLVECGSSQALRFATSRNAPIPPQQQLPQQQSRLPTVPVSASSSLPAVAVAAAANHDHFLCTCLFDSQDEACDSAVRAACMMGHLKSEWCHDSFSKGQHKQIADQILVLLKHGEGCVNYKRDESTPPPVVSSSSSLQGTPSKADHYLCVCLDQNEPEKCRYAVQAACIVGHIPAGDCAASLDRDDHDGASRHLLKLIDQGATCSQKLLLQAAPTLEAKRKTLLGRVASAFSFRGKKGTSSTNSNKKTITAEDKDLCYCLDDMDSEECGKAVKRACAKGKIPRDECQVGRTTAQVLRLIDHGADCPAHRSMTFTNHGCHCLQSWTSSRTREVLSFPNNCADPGGERGFAWCKTYASEQCAGVKGAVDWDRCDAPKYPAYAGGEAAGAQQQQQSDHYLCVCLADTSTDEVCVAAVKAACQVGHLPQEACRDSFDADQHGRVSDSILQLLQNGQRCDKSTMQRLMSGNVQRVSSEGGGRCPEGYFGFPNCRPKKPCAVECRGRGSTCDFDTGECACRPNFVGKSCSRCAPGTSGRHCLPDSELAGGGGGGGDWGSASWWLGWIQIAVVCGVCVYVGRWMKRRGWCGLGCGWCGFGCWSALKQRLARPARMPVVKTAPEYGQVPLEEMLEDEDGDEERGDLGDDEVPVNNKKESTTKRFSGLAV